MTLDTKLLTFTANTSQGNQDLTGTSFTPKAAIVWTGGINNAADAFVDGYSFSYGYTDGTNNVCVNMVSKDTADPTDTARSLRTDALIYNISESDVTALRDSATFVSWLSNGMRINWGTAAGSAFKFHVLFLGGDDITNVACGMKNCPTAAQYAINTLGFAPDIILACGTGSGTSGDNAIATNACISLGAATSTADEFTLQVTAEDGRSNADTWQCFSQSTSRLITIPNSGSGTNHILINLDSIDASGFTVTSSGMAYASTSFLYLALKGGLYQVGYLTEPANTGNQQITTTDIDVKAVHLFGVGTTSTSAVANAYLCTGAGTGSSEMISTYIGDLDSASATAAVSRYETDSIYIMCTTNATASSSTIDEEADLAAVTNGSFTINWSNIGGGYRVIYIVFGTTPGGGGELKYGTINESPSISVSESLARVQIIQKSISDTPTVGVSETLARQQTLIKSISDTPTISISETLARGLSYPRSITNEPDVTIPLETIAKTASYPRPIEDAPTISVSETLARVQTILKAISESSISTSASVVKILSYLKIISETPSINISEQLARVQTLIKAVSETAVSVGAGALTRLRTSIKSISDTPIISVSESLARLKTLIKSISSESAVNVSESIAKIFHVTKSISNEPPVSTTDLLTGSLGLIIKEILESSVPVSEQLAKILMLSRVITESPSITTSEQLARVQTLLKVISDTPVVTTSEQLTRAALYLKPISETAILTPSDSIARWVSISYAIAEPSISVGIESIEGALFYLRAITNEGSISATDSLARIQTILKSISATEEGTISVSESLARVQTLLKSISETPAINTTGSPTRTLTRIKPITNEPPVNISVTVARIMAATRTVADTPVISISEQIARTQTLIKAISETPVISTSDNIERVITFVTALVEARIKWYYSTFTRKI